MPDNSMFLIDTMRMDSSSAATYLLKGKSGEELDWDGWEERRG